MKEYSDTELRYLSRGRKIWLASWLTCSSALATVSYFVSVAYFSDHPRPQFPIQGPTQQEVDIAELRAQQADLESRMDARDIAIEVLLQQRCP